MSRKRRGLTGSPCATPDVTHKSIMQSSVVGRTYATYGQNRLNIREYSRTFANIREYSRIFANLRKSSRIFANGQAILTVRR
eukprot:3319697-Prymnesium_polylepis.1